MSLFGSKRPRFVRRESARLTSTVQPETGWYLLHERGDVLRIGLILLAIAGLVLATQAWRMPFPFRLDQEPVDGVVAKIQFRRVNQQRTTRDRERAAEEVPLSFVHDPKPLETLPAMLQADIQQFASAVELAAIPADLQRSFGLDRDRTAAMSGLAVPLSNPAETFLQLKQLGSDPQQLQNVVTSFTEFIRPLQEVGVVRPEHFTRLNDRIEIRDPNGTLRRVSLAEVHLMQLMGPSGKLNLGWGKYHVLQPLRAELEQWLFVHTPETLTYDDDMTQRSRQKAREQTPEYSDLFNRGDLLVTPGEFIDQQKLDLLWSEYQATEAVITPPQRWLRVSTVCFMLIMLAVLNGHHMVRHEKILVRSFSRLGAYLLVMVLTTALCRALSFDPWRAEIVPLLATAMIFSIAYSQVLAMLSVLTLTIIHVLATGANVSQFVVLISAASSAVMLLPNLANRSRLVIVGGVSAFTYLLMYWCAAIVEDQSIQLVWRDPRLWIASIRGAGWCLAAGFLVSGSLPFIESLFGVVTDISLLELGDVSHPLLQELVRKAPGSYNHSIAVASLAETAADRIGANSRLVRVGAYFHDVGKMLKPQYFVENQLYGSESKHDHLAPAMSTLIIIGHVKNGVDLAQQYHLPQPLIDFIEQHHGTTLVEYFYHEASRLADEDHKSEAEESNFRYPGPKPQSREAAVLMIADAVEGASRTLREPSPTRIEKLVHDIALKRLLDGQFDECDLTLAEIHQITDSLTKSLLAMYHGRVKYPDQRTA